MRASGPITDRPDEFSAQVPVSDDDVARIRSARAALGARIEHLQARLPSIADLPGGRALAHLHADILRADAFHAQAQNDASIVLRINSAEALDRAERAAEGLDLLLDACRHLDAYPFLRPLCRALHSVRDAVVNAINVFLSDFMRYDCTPDIYGDVAGRYRSLLDRLDA